MAIDSLWNLPRVASLGTAPSKPIILNLWFVFVQLWTSCHGFSFFMVCFHLQDWKDHQHTCCQSAGGVASQDDEPITAMDMDKVKWRKPGSPHMDRWDRSGAGTWSWSWDERDCDSHLISSRPDGTSPLSSPFISLFMLLCSWRQCLSLSLPQWLWGIVILLPFCQIRTKCFRGCKWRSVPVSLDCIRLTCCSTGPSCSSAALGLWFGLIQGETCLRKTETLTRQVGVGPESLTFNHQIKPKLNL